MKILSVILFSIALLATPLWLHTQTHGSGGVPKNTEERKQLLKTITGDHSLMMMLIDEIKASDHASMMIESAFADAPQASPSDHANCPMKGTPGHTGDTETQAKPETGKSPYVGEEKRSLKALSPEQIEQYLAGKGMGLAKVAELNHYPGPMHVLELADDLHLSPDQRSLTQRFYDEMHDKAVELGRGIVEKEEKLEQLFAGGKIAEAALLQRTAEIAVLQGKLRAAHLTAHLQMAQLLTPEQIKAYDDLRGYGSGAHRGASEEHAH